METNKILELVKKAEDKVNSTMLSNIRKTEINLILLEIQKAAINYSQCCTEFICHSCNEKKSGQNDDQLHEVCK